MCLEGAAAHAKGVPALVPQPGGKVAPAHQQQQGAAQQQGDHHGGPAGHAQAAIGQHTAVEHRHVELQSAEQRIGARSQVGEVFQRTRRLDAEQRQQHRPVGIAQPDGQKGRRQDQHHRDQRSAQQRPEPQPATPPAPRMRHVRQAEVHDGMKAVGQRQRHEKGCGPGNPGTELIRQAPAFGEGIAQQPEPEVVQKQCADQHAGRYHRQAQAQPDQNGLPVRAGERGRVAPPAQLGQPAPPFGNQPERTGEADQPQQHRPAKDALRARDEQPHGHDQRPHQQLLAPGWPGTGLSGHVGIGDALRAHPGVGIEKLPAAAAHPGPVQAQGEHHEEQVGNPDTKVVPTTRDTAYPHPTDRNRWGLRDGWGCRCTGLHVAFSGCGSA